MSPVNCVEPANQSRANQSREETLQKAAAAVRFLNGASDTDREFSVTRDSRTHKFVIIVRDRSTGTLIDQFPPEDILKLVSQTDPKNPKARSC